MAVQLSIKRVIFDDINYINFITFNISTVSLKKIFLICPAEIEVRLIHP